MDFPIFTEGMHIIPVDYPQQVTYQNDIPCIGVKRGVLTAHMALNGGD